MPKRLSYTVALSGEDELRFSREWNESRELFRVSVHYQSLIKGKWHEVCRYDNAHGPPHVHRFWGEPSIELLAPDLPAAGLLERGRADLIQNWKRYRQSLEARQ